MVWKTHSIVYVVEVAWKFILDNSIIPLYLRLCHSRQHSCHTDSRLLILELKRQCLVIILDAFNFMLMLLHCHDSSHLLSSLVGSVWVTSFISFFGTRTFAIWAVFISTFFIIFFVILVLHFLLETFKLLLEVNILNELMLSVLPLSFADRKFRLCWNSKLEDTLRFPFDVFRLRMIEARITHECRLCEFILAWELPFKGNYLCVLGLCRWRWEVFNVAETFRMESGDWESRSIHL